MSKDLCLDLVAAVLLVGAIGSIIYVNVFKPHITDSGALSEAWSRTITFGVTAVATLFTTVVSGQIQRLILRSFENELRDLDAPSINFESQQSKIESMETKWRGALKIDSLGEKLKCPNLRYLLIFTICGLNTTSIVTAFTPSVATRDVYYQAVMSSGIVPEYASSSAPLPCAGRAPPDTVPSGETYSWTYDNGSVFFSANSPDCPISKVLDLIPSINTINTSDYVYLDSGAAVKRSAIGAPVSTHNGTSFNALLAKYGSSLVRTQQCVPVVTSNPVKCRKGGRIETLSTNEVTLESGVDGTGLWDQEQYDTTFSSRNFTHDSVMVNYQWLKPNTTSDADGLDTIGLSLLAFAAYDPNGSQAYTDVLAGAMNDDDPDRTPVGDLGSSYVVTCTLDARKVFGYRMVTLNLDSIGDGIGTNFAYYLEGGESCKPENDVINDVYLATAARASQASVLENRGESGYIATIRAAAGFNRGPPYAFNNSENALEDVLGLAVGMAIANLPVEEEDSPTRSLASVQAMRLGSGTGAFYLLLIPSLSSLVILVVLLVRSIRGGWAPGGQINLTSAGYSTEDSTGGSMQKWTDRYAAESLYHLMALRSHQLQ